MRVATRPSQPRRHAEAATAPASRVIRQLRAGSPCRCEGLKNARQRARRRPPGRAQDSWALPGGPSWARRGPAARDGSPLDSSAIPPQSAPPPRRGPFVPGSGPPLAMPGRRKASGRRPRRGRERGERRKARKRREGGNHDRLRGAEAACLTYPPSLCERRGYCIKRCSGFVFRRRASAHGHFGSATVGPHLLNLFAQVRAVKISTWDRIPPTC